MFLDLKNKVLILQNRFEVYQNAILIGFKVL